MVTSHFSKILDEIEMGQMTRFLLLQSFLLCLKYLAAEVEINYADNTEEHNIIGGQKARPGQFKYQVVLYVYNKFHCGGSIIDERHVLTALHCVENIRPSQIFIRYGITSLNDVKSNRFDIEKIIPHENYNNKSKDHDIALLRIKGYFRFNKKVNSIQLATHSVKDNTNCIVSGWGNVDPKTLISSIDLKFAVVSIYNLNYCKQMYRSIDISISDNSICAGDLNKGDNAHKGDSGGPLVCNNKLVGIVSWGYPIDTRYPTVYTDVFYHIDWIRKNIARG